MKKIVSWVIVCLMVAAAAFGDDIPDMSVLVGEKIGNISRGMGETEVVRELGRPDGKSKFEFEPATGNTLQTWTYKKLGLAIQMNKEKARIYVVSITAEAPCRFATKRGIAIGSTAAQVKKAYPPDTWDGVSSRDDWIVVGSIYDGLMFAIEKGRVVRIFMGAAAE